ncbi:MAG: IS1 family transposase [Desulfobacterales bacterium]|nr:IS1 family transposase [Desulfobacterales bacterium]
MSFIDNHCPECKETSYRVYKKYVIRSGEERQLYKCNDCDSCFSETKNTVLEGLKTPVFRIIMILNALTEGMGINAATRVFFVGKNSIYRWQERLSSLQQTLMLYSLCQQFIQSIVEGDELYTKIGKNLPPSESEGWTIVLMERASRFIWALECGKKDERLFKKAMRILLKVIRKTDDLTLLTDGERRYGNILFEICYELLKTGKAGRPRKTLEKGVKVRVKNKGSQKKKPGRKREKYQAPQSEHPDTAQNIENSDIHANHVEGFNAALRRMCSAFRRKTNTYAKKTERLQERLNVIWIIHNFVRVHYTTKEVPAVTLGLIEEGLTLEDVLRLKWVNG